MTNLNETNTLATNLHIQEVKCRVASDLCEKLSESFKDGNLAKALDYIGKDDALVRYLNQVAIRALAVQLDFALGTRFDCFDKLLNEFRKIEYYTHKEASAFCWDAVYEKMREHLIEDLDEALKP